MFAPLAIALIAAAPHSDSVYSIDPVIDSAVIGGASLGVLLPYAFSSGLIDPHCPCSPDEVSSFDRSVIGNHNVYADTLSDVQVPIALLAPVIVDLIDVGASEAWFEDMIVFAEVLAINGAITTLTKYLWQRPLPVVYSGQVSHLVDEPGGYRSFISGHTSMVVSALTAASMTYSARHGASAWPWLITGVFGTSVALERVAAGRHFYTDVIAGAGVGLAVGALVPWLHKRRSESGVGLTLLPREDGIELGLAGRF
jgi:membrane-associated phospholipid phosphatase